METAAKQTRLVDPILAEIDEEAAITKRLLEIIPEDKLTWRPHPKARSLGELATHLANLQGSIAELGQPDSMEVNPPPETEASSRAKILEIFAESLKKTKEIIGSTDDARATSEWRLTKDGQTILALPRIKLWRSILLNHNYHHRGQLSTYLRTLDILLPSIYGPSADTNPFTLEAS